MPAKAKTNTTIANLGFEAKLWLAADKLRKDPDIELNLPPLYVATKITNRRSLVASQSTLEITTS